MSDRATINLEPHDRFLARFDPLRVDDLKPGVADWIGWEGEWEALWWIDEEDGGSYVGQLACGIADRDLRPPFVWVPMCDLTLKEATANPSLAAAANTERSDSESRVFGSEGGNASTGAGE